MNGTETETETSDRHLAELTRGECFELLLTQPVGRVAVAVPGAAPHVVPVNFILDGEAIVFRSGGGTKLDLLRGTAVAFQVDFVDWAQRCGWSVLAKGVAYEATHYETDHLALTPWADGDRRHWVRMVISELTGRRIERIDLPWPGDSRG